MRSSASNTSYGAEPVVRTVGLSKTFNGRGGAVRAVHNVSLMVETGSTHGVVGESGSGKSTLARLMMRLIEPTSGELYYGSQDALRLKGQALRGQRLKMQMVFQNPYGSLLPGYTALANVMEPLRIHRLGTKDEWRARAREMLELVGIGLERGGADRYPRQFSGGQQQRIAIARALVTQPDLLVCDEPTSALDVSIQAQILSLIKQLQAELGFGMLFISHNLAVVERLADQVTVMKAGETVETGVCSAIFNSPQHEYTTALLKSALPVHA